MFLPVSSRRRFRRASILAVCLAFAPIACGASAQKDPKLANPDAIAPVEIVHEECDVDGDGAVRMDVNGDGRPDIVRVMRDGREVCRAIDLNFDGRVDVYVYYDDQGRTRRQEIDYDRDGLIDEIVFFRDGVVVAKHRETNLDGKLDTFDTYVNGVLTERRLDANRDGKYDQWWTFPDPNNLDCPVIALDETGVGKPTVQYEPCKERDTDVTAPNQAPLQPAQGAGGGSR